MRQKRRRRRQDRDLFAEPRDRTQSSTLPDHVRQRARNRRGARRLRQSLREKEVGLLVSGPMPTYMLRRALKSGQQHACGPSWSQSWTEAHLVCSPPPAASTSPSP